MLYSRKLVTYGEERKMNNWLDGHTVKIVSSKRRRKRKE